MKILGIIALIIPVICAMNTTLLSWNIGLEEIWADQRAPVVIQSVSDLNADFVCLIEVWGGPSRIKQFVNELPQYPYHLTLIDENYIQSTEPISYIPPCQISEELDMIKTLTECIGEQCLDSQDDDCYMTCLSEVYSESFQRSPCYACLVEQVYKIYYGTKEILYLKENVLIDVPKLVLESLSVCSTDTTQPWIQTLGLLILSKTEFTVVETGFYPTFVVPRGYFIIDWNNTLTTCTHFTVPDIGTPYLAGVSTNYTSWDEENEGESMIITQLMKSLEDKYPRQLLMGDFNHGPAVPDLDVSAVDPLAYDIILATNRTDLYVQAHLPCTACEDNNIVDTTGNPIFDHFWIKDQLITGNLNTTDVFRFFDGQVNININGQCMPSYLSDHYGILVHYGSHINKPMQPMPLCELSAGYKINVNWFLLGLMIFLLV